MTTAYQYYPDPLMIVIVVCSVQLNFHSTYLIIQHILVYDFFEPRPGAIEEGAIAEVGGGGARAKQSGGWT